MDKMGAIRAAFKKHLNLKPAKTDVSKKAAEKITQFRAKK